jgi:hypothetical protein
LRRIRLGEGIPKKKMSEVEITKEQVDALKMISAVTKALAENPQLTKEIAEIFNQVAEEKERELAERITNLLTEKVKDIPAEQIRASYELWAPCCFPPEAPPMWRYLYPHFPPEAPPMWRYLYPRVRPEYESK